MAWNPYGESWMPLVDRALGEVIRSWANLTIDDGSDWPEKATYKGSSSPAAVASFFEHIADRLKQPPLVDLPGAVEGKKLYIQKNLTHAATASNVHDLGKYLRNAFQYLIQSPTIVPNLEPAGEVAILGVGASIHAGLPNTEDLFKKVKEELKNQCRTSYNALDETPDKAWSWAWRGKDMEELLSALQTSAWAKRAFQQATPTEDNYMSDLLCAYRSVIVAEQSAGRGPLGCLLRDCRHPTTVLPEEITKSFLDSFNKCAHEHGNDRWAIISFNQDTVVEAAAFVPNGPAGADDKRKPEDQVWTWKNGYGYIVSESKLPLYYPIHNHRIYKPHGTVAWYRTNATFPQLGACNVDWGTLHMSTLPKVSWNNDLDKTKPPLILVPSFFKDYEDKIIWDTIAKVCFELQNARHIRIVGFRLRNDDTLMSHLIRLSLRNNVIDTKDNPTVELIGPDAESDAEGSLGKAWAPILSALAVKGWNVERHPWMFHEYVLHKCWD